MHKIVWILLVNSSLFPLMHDSHHYHHYLFGVFSTCNHEPKSAERAFDIVFKNNGPSYAYDGFAQHLHATQQFDKLITFMPTIEQKGVASPATMHLYAQALTEKGHLLKATTIYTELAEKCITHTEIVYHAVVANVNAQNHTQALKLIDQYLTNNNQQQAFIFHFLKGQILGQQQKLPLAIKELQTAVELNPRFDQAWLLLGLTHQQNGTIEQAIHAFKQCAACSGSNALLERQIIQLQLQHQSLSKTNSSQEFEKALALFDKGNLKEALAIVEEALKWEQHSNLRLLKLEILCRTGNVAPALAALKGYIELDPLNNVWFKALYMIYKAGAEPVFITNLIAELKKELPNNLLIALYSADFALKENNRETALASLNDALSIANEAPIRMKCYLQIAHISYELKNYDAMGHALRSAYELDKQYPPLLNMLAYHYAHQGNSLEQAQALVSQALTADPTNYHYLDTQAVIWYKQSNNAQALQSLKNLAQANSHDSAIHKHLGKALFKQGMKAEAIKALQTAQALTTIPAKKEKYLKKIQAWNNA